MGKKRKRFSIDVKMNTTHHTIFMNCFEDNKESHLGEKEEDSPAIENTLSTFTLFPLFTVVRVSQYYVAKEGASEKGLIDRHRPRTKKEAITSCENNCT